MKCEIKLAGQAREISLSPDTRYRQIQMKKILILILSLLFSSYTYANWYQVEIIVFEHLYPDTGGEQWYNNQGLPDVSNSVELVTDKTGGREAYQVLSSGQHKINGVYSALKSSRDYRPIMHIAWKQPGLTRSKAQYVHIRRTEGISDADSLQEDLVKVDGTVRLRGGHFLYLDIDLAYFFKSLPESMINSAMLDGNLTKQISDYTRLSESRKIKLNELHYFDHPLFGVITWVRRLSTE